MRRIFLLALTAPLLLAACGSTPTTTATTPPQGTEVADFTELSSTEFQPLATGGCGIAPNTVLTYNSWQAGYASSILGRNFCAVQKDIAGLQRSRIDLESQLNQVLALGSILGGIAGYVGGPLVVIPAAAAGITWLSTSNTLADYDRAISGLNNLVARCKTNAKSEGVAYLLGFRTSANVTQPYVIFTTSTGRTFNTPQGNFISRDGCVFRS
jgi:hypothetical protein